LESDPTLDRPILAVLQASEAFAKVWEGLAEGSGFALRSIDASGPQVPDPITGAAVLLAVGGIEEQASEQLSALGAARTGPLAVVGSVPDHRLASALVRQGAADYFCLPQDLGALSGWLGEQGDRARAATRSRALAVEERTRYDFSALVGESQAVKSAIERASRIIPRGTAAVLITGETGTGKELLAQAIHYNGPRAAQPFMEVNCAALPESLLESELFGHEKGAFTDARTSKPGLFEAATGGSVFLDEIGDISLQVQAKLLKVLEEKRTRRLGSVRTIEVDVRVITATHVDLAQAVERGSFRADLFYRLNVLPIHLAPVRARGDDVLLLAEHFLDRASAEYEVPRPSLDAEARRTILAHPWPGNVRELKNAIERAVLLGDGSIRAAELFHASATPRNERGLPFPATLREIEVAAAREAVQRLDGNKSAAADLLDISRTRLYRLLTEEGASDV
jgi:two-component system response regulator HydG